MQTSPGSGYDWNKGFLVDELKIDQQSWTREVWEKKKKKKNETHVLCDT
jgi:hypothetical protein